MVKGSEGVTVPFSPGPNRASGRSGGGGFGVGIDIDQFERGYINNAHLPPLRAPQPKTTCEPTWLSRESGWALVAARRMMGWSRT